MQKLKCRTAYNARDDERVGLVFSDDESLTQQHFKQESDVNYIVGRYLKTGEMDWINERPPHYGDVTDIPTDLMSAYEAVERAEVAFGDLPSEIRKSLDNDPARLSEWLLDEKNRDLAIKHGLIVSPTNTVVEPNIGSETVQESAKAPENKGS